MIFKQKLAKKVKKSQKMKQWKRDGTMDKTKTQNSGGLWEDQNFGTQTQNSNSNTQKIF